MNPAYITAVISFLIVVTSAAKFYVAARLNTATWINLPSQLQVMNPLATLRNGWDPSTLILMNSPYGFLHAT